MKSAQQPPIDELQYYFVVKQRMPDGSVHASLSSYAPFRDDVVMVPFETEEDAALNLLEEQRNAAIVSGNDIEIARAVIRGDRPLFLYEEKQPDGTLLLSLHDTLPPEGARVVTFGSRAPRTVARLLLRRLHESERVRAITEAVQQAHALLNNG